MIKENDEGRLPSSSDYQIGAAATDNRFKQSEVHSNPGYHFMGKIYFALRFTLEIVLIPLLVLAAVLSRLTKKRIDIGLGPLPLINNIYHKQSLELVGYTAQTFVREVYHITNNFDVRVDNFLFAQYFIKKKFSHKLITNLIRFLTSMYLYLKILNTYECLYIYFNGGPFGTTMLFLWRMEPFLYKLAKIKIVVMPYGADVQDMSRSANLFFKHAIAKDYPEHRFRRKRIISMISLWTNYADHVISGCEWVDYMYYWDTLTLAHFSIDTDTWKPELSDANHLSLKILHAPNHREQKGSKYFIDAINELKKEGHDITLIILENVPNDKVKEIMQSVDIVADQLIIGWYAMFALEAMCLEKPVLCYLREDLLTLYRIAGLIDEKEIPIINCNPLNVKEKIKELYNNRNNLREIGKKSREYVKKHHSLNAMGKVFDKINRSIGLFPSSPSGSPSKPE